MHEEAVKEREKQRKGRQSDKRRRDTSKEATSTINKLVFAVIIVSDEYPAQTSSFVYGDRFVDFQRPCFCCLLRFGELGLRTHQA